MPSIRESQNVKMDKMVPVGGLATPMQTPPPPQQSPSSSPFMLSSLPPNAAGLDQYVRQFYDKCPTLPTQRVLPIGIEDGEVE